MTFDEAFTHVIGVEGGYSDHAADPGGKTRHGISEAVAREHGYRGPMHELPLDFAKRIYRAAYWDKCRCDDLPPAIRSAVFDGAVNSGVRQAAIWLQRAVDARPDGVVGPETITRARSFPPDLVKRRMLGQRLRFMTGLQTWPHFSRGWARRVADLLEA